MTEHALIIAMIVLFLHACSWRGMIFSGIKNLVPPRGMLYKPLYGCPICMTPWYGTLIYFLFFEPAVTSWLLTVGTASGFNVLSVLLIDIKDGICKPKTDETEP